ncbi:uncharacterized protein PSANT_05500 [Moesziomyces antarcticus]|nr:uncharacterized protein PSANT_05500 [Moesziomyces antarcticus]
MSSIAGPSGAHEDDVVMVDSEGNTLATSPGAEEGGSDAPEDEYEIEYIVSHSTEETDDQLSYFVKWKGYPESENTWVFESDMGGAQEMISEYWAKLPQKLVQKVKGGKKKRQSSTPQPSKRARRESSVPTRRNKRTNGQVARSVSPDDEGLDDEDAQLERIRSDPSLADEERALLETQHLHAKRLDRLRKRYARIADWDPIVRRIEGVEKMSDNKIRVFIHFDNGDKLAFESAVAHHRCPLKLLQFYEANLRFRERDATQEPPLVGEEPTEQLDQYLSRDQDESQQDGQDGQQQQEEEEEVVAEAVAQQDEEAEEVEQAPPSEEPQHLDSSQTQDQPVS